MKSAPFTFKQFTVQQGNVAMKVTTDAVLLGAWQPITNAARVLDIGTGTGLLALMMAQQNARAVIDAIDIDETACLQAHDNFADSPWANRLHVFNSPLQTFSPAYQYDVIICNPPYFIADHQSPDAKRTIARHSATLTYTELVEGISRLLLPAGVAIISLPVFNVPYFEALAHAARLHLASRCDVTARHGKSPYLSLLKLSKQPAPQIFGTIEIEASAGIFDARYKQLTSAFYLQF